ncbi:putative ubiquitin-like-specific protease 1B [Platanthera guangdongensis]|uniref:Ubiquitin-like-specific protease 1B n=1 Tax=Platanthera guangdongensis TaxID=2320717 RepID=A0ABR2MAH9_9ASPA
MVITTFANVGDDELSLLGVEELESDFEPGPKKKEKRKRDVNVDSLGYESEKEKKMKYKKQEKELLKKIRSEIKKERKGNVKSDEGWRGMEARLKSYIKSELKALQEDALHAFPEGFNDWSVEDARKSPQQSNSYDCGVFVIKYMEVVTSSEDVTWQDHQGWQADMPRFRAEIAAQIFKTFARHIADKMNAC